MSEVIKKEEQEELEFTEEQKHMHELQRVVIDQQKELDLKSSEIKEMNSVYQQFKQESEELEDLLKSQVNLFETSLEATQLAKTQQDASYAQQLVNIKTKQMESLLKKDLLINNLKSQINDLKEQLIENGIAVGESKKDKKKEGEQEFNQDEFNRMKFELEQKNEIIKELEQDIKMTKKTLTQQSNIFQEFSKSIDKDHKQILKDQDEAKEDKNSEIEILNKIISEKDEMIKSLKKYKKVGPTNIDEDEVEELKNLVVTQGKKIKIIAKDYIEYKEGAEKLLDYEKLVRDTEIEVLKQNNQSLTEMLETNMEQENKDQVKDLDNLEKLEGEERKI